jgi:hypothetical protein
MEKRYQVFISSTFQDLQGARQEVSQALLRADCFPAGMELFPAADEEQFEFIKTVIDQSDYYIIISAGRYGSIHPETGLSYTEMEYDYAVEIGVPIIRLLHKDPFNRLLGQDLEQSDAGRAKLHALRSKISDGRLVNFWSDPTQLGLLVVNGLMDAIKRKPATGWTRADRVASEEAVLSIAKLEKKIAELETELVRQEKTFNPQVAFDSIDEFGSILDRTDVPIRDLCFLLLAAAFNSTRKLEAVNDAIGVLNTWFKDDIENVGSILNWLPITLEAAGLVTISLSEKPKGDSFVTVEPESVTSQSTFVDLPIEVKHLAFI